MTVRRWMMSVALLLASRSPLSAQDRGAARIHALVNGLTVTPRVLIVGARPSDADADLIAWLARGHRVQTAFLSLTRGESAPNYTGLEAGAALGAVHVEEALAARRIDGGEQYFTRAYDFGSARSAAEAFKEWDHAELLKEVVTVARAFRPHVIIALFRTDTSDRDGQHQVSAILARDVFDASPDTLKFPVKDFGLPWTPQSLFEPGTGVTIDSRDYDRVLGRTYADIAVESRAQLRSFGFATAPWQTPSAKSWRRIATRVTDASTTERVSSFFAGIDTSFARLLAGVPADLVRQVPAIIAYADSAKRQLDLMNPSSVVGHLKRLTELVATSRILMRGCRHPAADAAVSLSNRKCQAEWLDLDASLDLVQRRSADALLAATGVTVEAVADREFLASYDTALVTVTAFNNGDTPISLNDVRVTGAVSVRMLEAVDVPAHGSAQLQRAVTTAPYAHPWWIFKRKENFYPPSTTPLDGVPRPGMFVREFGITGTAIPENLRRLSDVTVTLTYGTTTLTTTVGNVVYKTADPVLGVRDRALSGVPAVTLGFERGLEWAQAGKPLKRPLRVTLRSFSDKPQTLTLKSPMPAAVKLDSFPPAITLAPREAREISLLARGAPEPSGYILTLIGVGARDTLEVGFKTAQYSYLAPIHLFREAGVKIQAVDIDIPSRLSVAYIRGAGDDGDLALKQLGVPVYALNTEGLIRFDLDGLSTVAIGPDAFRADRALYTQMSRLNEFVRKGGTLVVMGNPDAVTQPGVLPFPVSFAQPFVEQVVREDAQVVPLDARARLLAWPNVIAGPDWSSWVGPRATTVPSVADPRYAQLVESHDPDQKENRNSILVATVGKGRVIYTSLTLTQQIANAVPGAMRIFVNLLSAGLPVERKVATSP
ncbi:MAG: PIG-L family deacetylase [Gemmatimonadota bacterium]